MAGVAGAWSGRVSNRRSASQVAFRRVSRSATLHGEVRRPFTLCHDHPAMDADEYRRMAAAGERHWWYASTRRLLAELVVPHLGPVTSDTRYLDAAGGSGATGAWLAALAPTLVDD